MTSPASFAGLVRWLVVISVVPSKVFRTSGKIIVVFNAYRNNSPTKLGAVSPPKYPTLIEVENFDSNTSHSFFQILQPPQRDAGSFNRFGRVRRFDVDEHAARFQLCQQFSNGLAGVFCVRNRRDNGIRLIG